LWSGLYHITGTDIVRALVFRFEAFGRPVRNVKKFEEGVFSDLRNLKPGVDACLEEPKSPFLDLLFKYQCIRTQKKQKVFYWCVLVHPGSPSVTNPHARFSVSHDRLFLDALERDLKREKMGLEPTTAITGEPAQSFTYDPKRSLYEQFSKAGGGKEGEGELEAAVRRVEEAQGCTMDGISEGAAHDLKGEDGRGEDTGGEEMSSDPDDHSNHSNNSDLDSSHPNAAASSSSSNLTSNLPLAMRGPGTPFFSMFSLFEGSPTYKQRRKKGGRPPGGSGLGVLRKEGGSGDDERGRRFLPASRYTLDVDMELEGMSAADMFVKQARGELLPASIAERRKLHGPERTRSHEAFVFPGSFSFSELHS
jgi:transcription factor STE12